MEFPRYAWFWQENDFFFFLGGVGVFGSCSLHSPWLVVAVRFNAVEEVYLTGRWQALKLKTLFRFCNLFLTHSLL